MDINKGLTIETSLCGCNKPHVEISSTGPKWMIKALYEGYYRDGFHPLLKRKRGETDESISG